MVFLTLSESNYSALDPIEAKSARFIFEGTYLQRCTLVCSSIMARRLAIKIGYMLVLLLI